MTCMRRCKIVLIAFFLLFSTVRLQMCPQIACLRRYKIALLAFVWFLSTVYFQICLQIACLNGCKVTMVAFVWFFSTVHFQIFHQIKVKIFKILVHGHYHSSTMCCMVFLKGSLPKSIRSSRAGDFRAQKQSKIYIRPPNVCMIYVANTNYIVEIV